MKKFIHKALVIGLWVVLGYLIGLYHGAKFGIDIGYRAGLKELRI